VIFQDSADFRSGGRVFAVKHSMHSRLPFDHLVLSMNKCIVQHVENDQFLINDAQRNEQKED